MIKAVLFDLDDTLLDRRRMVDGYLAGHERRSGLGPDAAANFIRRFHELDGCGYTSRPLLFQRLSDEFPSAGSAQVIGADFREHVWRHCEWMPGAIELLAWCRDAGLRSAIITNGSSRMQRAKLQLLDLESRVDAILISEEEGVAKPMPEIFLRAASRLGVDPCLCAFVGDHPLNDVKGARDVGMVDIWLRRELPWPSELPMASFSITRLCDVPTLLQGSATTPSVTAPSHLENLIPIVE